MSIEDIKNIKADIARAEAQIDSLDFQKHKAKGKKALNVVYQQLKWIIYRDILIASLDKPEGELQGLRQIYKGLKEMLLENYQKIIDIVGEDENPISIQIRFAPVIISLQKANIA